MQADEVEDERDAPSELRDELEVLAPVPSGLGRGDGEDAEPPTAGLQRDDDQRAGLHADDVLLAWPCDLLQRPRQRRAVHRLARAEDLHDRDAPVARELV